MGSDIKLLVAAIESLQSNVLKDYILPIGSVLVSGALGCGVAYYTVNKQESTRIELEKIKSINNTLLSALNIRSSLISIKNNYFEHITSEPVDRMLNIPPVLITKTVTGFDLSALSFLATSNNDENFNKWVSLDYISTISANYDTLVAVWELRNKTILELRPQVYELYEKPLNYRRIEQVFGVGRLSQLADLTERCLNMTDDVLVEINCFLIGFSESVKKLVDPRVLAKFSGLISPSLPDFNDYPKAVNIISKVPVVDYESLSEIMHRPVDELVRRYAPIYK